MKDAIEKIQEVNRLNLEAQIELFSSIVRKEIAPLLDRMDSLEASLKANQEKDSLKRMLTVLDVSSVLAVSKKTIYRLLENGNFPTAIRIGRDYKIPAQDLERYIQRKMELNPDFQYDVSRFDRITDRKIKRAS